MGRFGCERGVCRVCRLQVIISSPGDLKKGQTAVQCRGRQACKSTTACLKCKSSAGDVDARTPREEGGASMQESLIKPSMVCYQS